MRTKEEFIEELKSINLAYTISEPKVGSSVLSVKGKKDAYKCCIFFNVTLENGIKDRKRPTINLLATTKKKAESEALELRKMCQEALHMNYLKRNKHGLITSMNRWIKALKKEKRLELNTIETMGYKMKVIERYNGFSNLAVEDTTAVDINKFMQWALDKGSNKGGSLSSVYVKGVHGMLFSFFSFAVSNGVISMNPCLGTKVPYKTAVRIDETRKAWMDAEEYKLFKEELIDKSKTYKGKHFGKLLDICDIVLFSGMRREELLALHWNDIDVVKKQLMIRSSRVQLGGTTSGIYREDLKNSSSYRIYGLTDRIVGIFIKIKEEQQKLGIYEENGYIFKEQDKTSERFGKEYRPEYISKLFKKAILSSDVINDKSLHFHSLRHSTCSLMFSAGYSLGEVQAWLGHKEDSKITMRVYNHYKNILTSDKLEKLENIIG